MTYVEIGLLSFIGTTLTFASLRLITIHYTLLRIERILQERR